MASFRLFLDLTVRFRFLSSQFWPMILAPSLPKTLLLDPVPAPQEDRRETFRGDQDHRPQTKSSCFKSSIGNQERDLGPPIKKVYLS
jgi:hypothetical protein